MSESTSDAFRWQSFFQHAAQPVFLLNRRRRILFVNRAWEGCTGLKSTDVRGKACKRRSPAAATERDDLILSACAPPADAVEGRTCQVRRRAPTGAGWWELHFMPLAGAEGIFGTLGMIRVLSAPTETPANLPDRLMALRDRHAARHRLDDIGDDSAAIQRLRAQARLAAQTRLPVTLLGETGTGKQWLARAIHEQGPQRQSYFACLDAERLPAAVIGELLFEPGPRRVRIGTVYLRNPHLLPRDWQGRLAEAANLGDNSEFPRLMVGFGVDPQAEIEANRLFSEFYFAVSPVLLTLPPLRDRRAELPHFCNVFLTRLGEQETVRPVAPETVNVLRVHAWPGNLRELQDVLRDANRRAQGERIEPGDLPLYLKQQSPPSERPLPLDSLLEQVEKRLILLALKLTKNNQTRAAELLEVWRPRLLRRMEKFGFTGE